MISHEKAGQRIAALRKNKGLTQEKLAEVLNVTGQAVSKWEKGNTLPDVSLLPALARVLGTSIDLLLNPHDLFVEEARWGAGITFADAAAALNHRVDECGLCIKVDNESLGGDPLPGIIKYLSVRYANADGVFQAYAGEGEALHIPPKGAGLLPFTGEGMEILAARYGSEAIHNDVTGELKSYTRMFPHGVIPVNHEYFASPPAVDIEEHLSVLYRNRLGFFVIAIPEGGTLALSADGRFLVESAGPQPAGRSRRIVGVPKLAFGQGRECTFAGALTGALNVLGEPVSYETVMGLSGACWRLAFCHPGWDFSSVDGLVVYDHAAPAWKALGYALTEYDRVEKKDREKVRAEIVESVDRGVPVLAIDLRVAPEWGVIAGYSDGGKTLWGRTYFDEGTENYLKAEQWPFILLFFGKRGAPLPARESLLQSLSIFVEEMNIPERRGYAMGYQAYAAWSGGLADETRFESLDEDSFRRLMAVNHFCYLALADARRAGSAYLDSCAHLLDGEAAQRLETASALYRQIASRLKEGWQWVPCEEQCQGDPRLSWTAEKRGCQVALLREIAGLEKLVESEFREILREGRTPADR
jgi:transcriptional regulator with XRE-family HTH domain